MLLHTGSLHMLVDSFLVFVALPASYFLTALTQLWDTQAVHRQGCAICLIRYGKGCGGGFQNLSDSIGSFLKIVRSIKSLT